MSVFFRQIQHLLPRGRAWRTTTAKTLRSYLEGLAAEPEAIRTYLDLVFEDVFPETTREIPAWEEQFGLAPGPASTENNRRAALDSAWKAQGGQSPSYIQEVVQAAGFPLYVHDWWDPSLIGSAPDPDYQAGLRDPRSYTTTPLIGTHQCSAFPSQPQCSGFRLTQPQCNRFLANDPGYLVNNTLTKEAPPPVPDDQQYWPHFIYLCAETFGDPVSIDYARRQEIETLLLKLCPTEKWIVLIVDWQAVGVFDSSFDESFE